MTDTMDIDLQAHEFAQAVRAQLADLSPDEVDDLTEGLEADLIEQARETGSFPAKDPVAYASELRVAAGMPVRSSSRPGFITAVRVEAAHLRSRVETHVNASPGLAALFGFLGSIRPLWWVARAWLGYLVVSSVMNTGWSWNPVNVIIFFVLLVISVQWGRGKWMPRRWLRVMAVLANILAILVIPLGIMDARTTVNSMNYSHSSEPAPYLRGLSRDGTQITNIFAYDANGDPISGAQLYDQDGKALTTRDNTDINYLYTNDGSYYLVPSDRAAGSSGWNIFPLSQVPQSAVNGYNNLKPGVTPTKVLFPFVKVRPLASTTQPSPTPTPTPTPAP